MKDIKEAVKDIKEAVKRLTNFAGGPLMKAAKGGHDALLTPEACAYIGRDLALVLCFMQGAINEVDRVKRN